MSRTPTHIQTAPMCCPDFLFLDEICLPKGSGTGFLADRLRRRALRTTKNWIGLSRCKTRGTSIFTAASVPPEPAAPHLLGVLMSLERVAHQLLGEDELIDALELKPEPAGPSAQGRRRLASLRGVGEERGAR